MRAAGALLAGLAVAAGSVIPTAAAGPRSQPPAGSTPVVPDDWTDLVDDSELLTVSVPTEWDDITTTPRTGDDGEPYPMIAAATDLATFRTTFDAPGLEYFVVPYSTSYLGVLQQYGLQSGCATNRDESYDDGAFDGALRHWTNCGASWVNTEVYNLAVSPPDDSMTLILNVQITSPDQRDEAAAIFESFNLTHLPSLSAPTAEPSPSSPADTAPASSGASDGTTPGGSPGPDAPLTIIDDLGALAVEVPPTWTEQDTSPDTDGYGNPTPYIAAAPDLARFRTGEYEAEDYSAPGIVYRAIPRSTDLVDYLATIDEPRCIDAGIEEYGDDLFEGYLHTFVDCAGASTTVNVVVVNPLDTESFTATLYVRLPADDSADLDIILQSFSYSPRVMEAVMNPPTSTTDVTPVT